MALEVAKRSLSIKDADAKPRKKQAADLSRSKADGKKSTKKSSRSTSGRQSAAKSKTTNKTRSVKNKTQSKTKTAKKQQATKTKKVTVKNTGKTTAKKKTVSNSQTKQQKKSPNKRQTKSVTNKKNPVNKKKTSKRASSRKVTTEDTISTVDEKHLRVATPLRKGDARLLVTKKDRLGHLLLEQLLRAEGFKGVVTTDKHILEEYSTDESIFSITPQLVLQPKDTVDVEIATKVVARETNRFASLSLTPRAAGTDLSGGSLTDSVVVDLQTNLTAIGELRYRAKTQDATITVEAGVKWRDMAAVLARAGYHVPTYSTAHEICTVGGAVANNAAGAMSERYGHCADFVESMEVVLYDGSRYQVEPLTYKQYKTLLKKKHTLAELAEATLNLLEQDAKTIKDNQLDTRHNTAGYNVWDVLPQGVNAFKKGKGTLDLTKLFTGAQGTIGIVTEVTLRALPFPETPTTIAVPVYNVADLPHIISEAKKHSPLQIEAFDAATYDLALRNPDYFRKHLRGLHYYRAMLAMYTTYHVRYGRRLPEFTVLLSFEQSTVERIPAATLARRVSTDTAKARVLSNPLEEEVLWLIRRAGYDLSRLQDETKRPAAFVEDMMVPIEALPKYITGVQKLCKEFNIQATMYGHIGNGHLHLFPLLDFTNKTTPALIEKMSEQFFSLATKHGGTMSAEHNDGIIRTPHLAKVYSKSMVKVFEKLEAIFDPDDIFNPGKKVNPRFVVRDVLRTVNY